MIASLENLFPYLPAHLDDRLTPDINVDDAKDIWEHIFSLRKVLSTYLPRYLVDNINADPTPGQVGGAFRQGAVLFADVSGFTAMSERLSTLGKEGAEEITGIVNDYFEAMLSISASYGGDLLNFGGDALLIFFSGDEGPHRALATGNAMQEAMSQFSQVKTSQGVFPLRMKIGMGSGTIFRASLGTPKSMQYVVMGRALTNMAQAEDKASAGQIIVDQTTRDASIGIADFRPAVDGFWTLESLTATVPTAPLPTQKWETTQPSIAADPTAYLQDSLNQVEIIAGLSSYVPEELLTRLIVDPYRPLLGGSHRPVTVMFANFYGIDKLIEAAGPEHLETITSILNTYFVTMDQVLSQYGGTTSRLDTYTLGHRIMGLFGALRAHEDDPQRAVRAAVEMNQSLAAVNQKIQKILATIPEIGIDLGDLPLKQRIGLNSGFVFAGNVGSSNRREYTVMGDQVNLTARLMSVSSEGDVLVGQSTARHVRTQFELLEKEPVKVKGISEPVRNYVVKAALQHPQRWATPSKGLIVGREQSLNRGRQAVEETLRGQGRLLIVSGDSGIGKTRLAEEIALYGELLGMELLVGACLSYGKTMTYHPWGDILRGYFGIRLTGDTQEAQTRVESVERGMQAIDKAEWSPVIGTVLGLDIPDNDLTRNLDAKLRRQRVLDLVVELLQERSQKRPLTVVVEDAHWADPASMDLINYVARNIAGYPILLTLIHRPDDGLPDWTVHPHAVNVPLDGLPDEACLHIVADMIGPVSLPDSIRNLIFSKASGNPFFLMEVVRSLIDTGALKQRLDGSWQIAQDIESVELPDTIHGMIISRIDRLLATDRRVLQVASVVGRVFALRILGGVSDYSNMADILLERLSYLGSLGLTESQNIELEIYRFIHLTTREVVYESLSFELRRELHRNIGAFIERTFADSLSEQTDLLAYHYFEGQDWGKALEYNLMTARHAQLEFANDIAITSARRALIAATRLSPDMDVLNETISAHEILGEVLTLVGRYDEALEQYASARALVDRQMPTLDRIRYLADLFRKTADVYERRSEFDQAFEWLEKGLRYLDESQPTIEMASIYLLGTGLYRRQGKNDEALVWCQKSLDIASKIPTRLGLQAMAHAYYSLSGIHWRRGDLSQAVQVCHHSLQIYQDIDDTFGQACAYNNLAIAYAYQGNWEQASEAFHKSLTINQRIGNIQSQGIVANNVAEIHRDRGEWDQAMGLYSQSIAIWKRLGASLLEGITMSNMAQVHIHQGNWPEAHECLLGSQAIFQDVGSEDYLPELERRWGEYYLKTGDLDQALSHTQRSIDLAASQEARLELGMSFRILGEIHRARREYDSAEVALWRSLRTLVDLNSEYEAAKTMLSLAQLAVETDDTVDQPQLLQAMQTFERLGAQADLNKAQELARVLDQ